MAMQLRARYDIGDGATFSLRFCVTLYKIGGLTDFMFI